MAFCLNNRLVVGVSSRALFNLNKENEIFEKQGVEAYCKYQLEHEEEILEPGPGFSLIKALLDLNSLSGQEGRVEVIIMSHNSPDTSLRVFNAIAYYQLNISRAVLASGASPAHERVIRTLRAWNVRIDEAFFLGGIAKRDVLKAFGAHIFFDDQEVHTHTAAQFVPSARVPYKDRPEGIAI